MVTSNWHQDAIKSSTTPTCAVVCCLQPGYLRPLLPASAPDKPEPWADIKRDFWGPIMKGEGHVSAYLNAATVGLHACSAFS